MDDEQNSRSDQSHLEIPPERQEIRTASHDQHTDRVAYGEYHGHPRSVFLGDILSNWKGKKRLKSKSSIKDRLGLTQRKCRVKECRGRCSDSHSSEEQQPVVCGEDSGQSTQHVDRTSHHEGRLPSKAIRENSKAAGGKEFSQTEGHLDVRSHHQVLADQSELRDNRLAVLLIILVVVAWVVNFAGDLLRTIHSVGDLLCLLEGHTRELCVIVVQHSAATGLISALDERKVPDLLVRPVDFSPCDWHAKVVRGLLGQEDVRVEVEAIEDIRGHAENENFPKREENRGK